MFRNFQLMQEIDAKSIKKYLENGHLINDKDLQKISVYEYICFRNYLLSAFVAQFTLAFHVFHSESILRIIDIWRE